MSESELVYALAGAAVGAIAFMILGVAMDLWCTCRGAKKPATELVKIDKK